MNKGKQILSCFTPFILALVILYGISFSVPLVYGVIAGVMGNTNELMADYENTLFKITFVATAVVHAAYILFFGKWYLQKLKFENEVVEKRRIKPTDIVIFIVLGLVLQVVVSYLLSWILPFFPNIEVQYQQLMERAGIGKGILPLILTGVMAPIGEEIIFRGLTIQLGKGVMPFGLLNLFQALLFGIYHMNIVQGIYAFAVGLILGLIFKKYQDIRACVILHACINIWGNLL